MAVQRKTRKRGGSRYKNRTPYMVRSGRFRSSGSGPPPRNILTLTGLNHISSMTRAVEYAQIDLGSATGDIVGAKAFILSDLPGYSEFSIYDQYKIEAIKVEFACTYAPSTFSGTSEPSPVLYTCIDTDDDSTPTGKSAVLAHESCRFHGNLNAYSHKVIRWLKPQAATALYSGTFTSYGAKTSPWIDIASSGVKHYGIKFCATNLAAETSAKLFIVATFYLSFRLPV